MNVRRQHGEILNCAYGHVWPLNLFTSGYVRIEIRVSRKGRPRLDYVWAATRAELQ